MPQSILSWMARAQVIVALLAVVLVTCPVRADRYGDRLQVALPLLAWACAGARGTGSEFFARYAVMFTTAHATKRALGDVPVNSRPGGGVHGFPSAHTATAVLGASALAHDCLRAAPLAQAVVIGAAAFVGASRIEAGAHDIWQVLAGAVLGFACDRALRHPSPARAALARLARQTGRMLRQGARMAVALSARLYRPASLVPRPPRRAAPPPPPLPFREA